MLTYEELAEIENRSIFGTPGPWTAYLEGRDHTSGGNFIRTGNDEDLEILGARMEDYDFIAHAKQDIPKLINEIRRLNEVIKNG